MLVALGIVSVPCLVDTSLYSAFSVCTETLSLGFSDHSSNRTSLWLIASIEAHTLFFYVNMHFGITIQTNV